MHWCVCHGRRSREYGVLKRRSSDDAWRRSQPRASWFSCPCGAEAEHDKRRRKEEELRLQMQREAGECNNPGAAGSLKQPAFRRRLAGRNSKKSAFWS